MNTCPDELYITVNNSEFAELCSKLHKQLDSPVMMFFAEDLRREEGKFALYCVFLSVKTRSWTFARADISQDKPEFNSLAKSIHSAGLFEREIKEMFGIEPIGSPDARSLRLHEEVWPQGYYPLRKDFINPKEKGGKQFLFKRVDGEGVFEVPVGPVHAGIIAPGHFRFSLAGEPIINLEIRLGWKHRGIEKLLEGKTILEAIKIFEHISGDTAFGYSSAFCKSAEKILGIDIPERAALIRALFLELERAYNHANGIAGIAVDVGFSFPGQFASLIKENILQLNEKLSGSRYLKGVNTIGGVNCDIDATKQEAAKKALSEISMDFSSVEQMLFTSVSFMDRVDATGQLRLKTARDLGITGLAARASGIPLDLRKVFNGIYDKISFSAQKEQAGDVSARLKLRFAEARESLNIIQQCLKMLDKSGPCLKNNAEAKEGIALGYAEAWRGPVLVWTRLNKSDRIERCKIVDPSFHNWEGLSYAALGNIIPDFPVCNKSFDLSYSGNDL